MVFHDHFEVILPRSHDFAAVWRRVLVILLVLRLLSPGDMPTRRHGTQDQRESNDYPHPAWYAHDVSSPQSHGQQTPPGIRQSQCADTYSSTRLTSSLPGVPKPVVASKSFWLVSQKTSGVINRLRNVPLNKPLKMTTATGNKISRPGSSGPARIGISAREAVRAVMSTGTRRSLAPRYIMCRSMLSPSECIRCW